MDEKIISKAFAFRLGDRMPKWLRILYYIVLFGTLVYVLVWLIAKLLVGIQKLGHTLFSPSWYWPIITSLFILAVGTFIVAQFILGLDPWESFTTWIENSVIKLFGGVYVGEITNIN
jgi:hypothetical protein